MIEKFVDIETPAGRMDAFVTHPEQGGPFPAVIIFMDIWGLREELFDVARRIGVVGYHCVLPNFYYRRGRVRFEYRNEKGEMRSLEALEPQVQEEIRDNMRLLTDTMVVDDVESILSFLDREPVREGAKAAVGYCMGGRHALRVAAQYPDRFRAAASLHGTRLVTGADDSPHLYADRFRGEIYCGFAEHDSLAPPSTIETLATLLRDRPNVRYHHIVHPGTEHGYALPDRDVFHKTSADRDWENIFAMLRRQIG